jgi:signal transduction histidine kinase
MRRGPGRHSRPVGATWWRRRFLRFAIVIAVLWIAVGAVVSVVVDGDRGPGDERRGPPAVVVAVVGAALLATFVAYRRLARPSSELLAAAERLGAGDYETRVQPSGPRAVRSLGAAFNEMAAQLDASEHARRRFLADVTHELRTPLAVLEAEIEAQLDGIHPRDEAHLGMLRDQTRTLERLVDDLRTLALSDAGRLTLHREDVSTAALADEAAAAIAATATGREVTVRVVGDDAELEADPVRLQQVLTNLLTNAVRHTPAGGTVTITTRADGGDVVFSVVDTGPGIAGDPERVFERFARSADSGGSGLGLSIARQLVEAHGGTLLAANEPSGGARFTATVPRTHR